MVHSKKWLHNKYRKEHNRKCIQVGIWYKTRFKPLLVMLDEKAKGYAELASFIPLSIRIHLTVEILLGRSRSLRLYATAVLFLVSGRVGWYLPIVNRLINTNSERKPKLMVMVFMSAWSADFNMILVELMEKNLTCEWTEVTFLGFK